ncbi:Zinc finger, GATA-type [Corchorus olitorius]|uniref:Zinc finger, GATA-type n=1 Tax=Corchorus olitorius TaxID=93759 RepID=A0A1R3JVQ2_9ROSI|nr:Zinc finger, GATA-type [Corchorus olitorius]
MDFCRNVSVSGEYQQEQVLSSPCSKLSTLDDLFPAQNTEVDVSMEWLSIFVEDCFSSTGNCIPVTAEATTTTTNGQNRNKSTDETTATTTTTQAVSDAAKSLLQQKQKPQLSSLQKFVVPGKARSKRKRTTTTLLSKTKSNPFSSWSKNLNQHNPNFQLASSDPPLLHQTYWLADSELMVPKKEEDNNKSSISNIMGSSSSNSEEEESKKEEEIMEEGKMMMVMNNKESLGQQQQQPRRCSHCLAQRTPQWRAGPLGPKTLCNACGVRYKSGRLLPEYRPAKSPTFVSYLHSNSHKKVMEMRMSCLSSIPSEQ